MNSWSMNIIRTVYYINGPELMKFLLFYRCDERCYKTEVFYIYVCMGLQQCSATALPVTTNICDLSNFTGLELTDVLDNYV